MITVEQKARQGWERMKQYQPENMNEEMYLIDAGFMEERIKILEKIKPNQYIVFETHRTLKGLNGIIEQLKEKGLNIGKGDSEYGYKMPLNKEGKNSKLIIFRRYE
jgi:hypothetical protein